MTAGQNSIYVNKNDHHHYPFSTGPINPNFILPQICKLYIFPSPGISIYHKVILYVKWLKHKLSSRLKKKSFSFSKINLERTICNTEDWYFFFFLKSRWKYFIHSHILPYLKKLHPVEKEHFFWEEGRFLFESRKVFIVNQQHFFPACMHRWITLYLGSSSAVNCILFASTTQFAFINHENCVLW